MQLEIQVALSFFISFMYNKLPRRRVNIFADELERALRCKFASHWYPDRPYKGSAYRCLKTAEPVDPVLEIAARESGLAVTEIKQTLPEDLSVWIDPGEVSYRIGERGQVKLLYSEAAAAAERCSTEESCDREVTASLSPAEQYGFRPIDVMQASMTGLSLTSPVTLPPVSNVVPSQQAAGSPFPSPQSVSAAASSPPTVSSVYSAGVAPSPVQFPPPRPRQPVTFTTAAFAQTKFGSTKLKTSGKRGSRMSPTEFSQYIKQRAMLQQPFAQRTLSPAPPPSQEMAALFSAAGSNMAAPMYDAAFAAQRGAPPANVTQQASAMFAALSPENQQLLESLTYAANPHLQHLLVAN